jgi:hypothetical protein
MNRKSIIFVDVGDTLIRTFGTKQIPIPRSADYARRMHSEGHVLYCWSRGGADYCRNIAIKLGIDGCFVGFIRKPDIVLDDRLEKPLDRCQFLHLNNAH